MHTITFNGQAHGPDGTIAWHGRQFRPGEPVETDHPMLIEMAKANPFFEVSGGDAPKDDDEDEDDERFGDYDVKHRGRGKWAVLKGDVLIAEGLTQPEADQHAKDLASADRKAAQG